MPSVEQAVAYLLEAEDRWAVIVDEGPEGYEAGPYTVTRTSKGFVDPRELAKIPGRRREHIAFQAVTTGNKTVEEWEALVDSIRREGVEYPPMITKEKDGQIAVFEGNHRIRAAIEAGLAKIPVEFRYWGNSQKTGLIPLDKGPMETTR